MEPGLSDRTSLPQGAGPWPQELAPLDKGTSPRGPSRVRATEGRTRCPCAYLMHDAPHELLVGHTGQFEVDGNTSRDVRKGAHDLPKEEHSGAIRSRTHQEGRKGHGLFCIMMKD